MEHYPNFCTFEIASLVNVPGHYLRKYGILIQVLRRSKKQQSKLVFIHQCLVIFGPSSLFY